MGFGIDLRRQVLDVLSVFVLSDVFVSNMRTRISMDRLRQTWTGGTSINRVGAPWLLLSTERTIANKRTYSVHMVFYLNVYCSLGGSSYCTWAELRLEKIEALPRLVSSSKAYLSELNLLERCAR